MYSGVGWATHDGPAVSRMGCLWSSTSSVVCGLLIGVLWWSGLLDHRFMSADVLYVLTCAFVHSHSGDDCTVIQRRQGMDSVPAHYEMVQRCGGWTVRCFSGRCWLTGVGMDCLSVNRKKTFSFEFSASLLDECIAKQALFLVSYSHHSK